MIGTSTVIALNGENVSHQVNHEPMGYAALFVLFLFLFLPLFAAEEYR